MFSAKVTTNVQSNQVNEIISAIYNSFDHENPKVISDQNSIEIVVGREPLEDSEDLIVELVVRKHIIINSQDLLDKTHLNKISSKISKFCQQAMIIESN